MRRADRDLVLRARAGSADAVTELVRRHWVLCHKIAFLVCGDTAGAEDIAQEAMLSAIRGLDGFDESRPLEPWLHRITMNKARDWLRRRARHPELTLADAYEGGGSEEPDLPEYAASELLGAIRELRPGYRVVVVARYVLDYTSGEIAELVDIPATTVRTQLRRALAELRMLLEKEARRESAT